MLISKDTHITSDFPGGGGGSDPYPPPPLDQHIQSGHQHSLVSAFMFADLRV